MFLHAHGVSDQHARGADYQKERGKAKADRFVIMWKT
jgi:hypothetical protein